MTKIADPDFTKAIDAGETPEGNIEFKNKLVEAIHLNGTKKESLTAQLKHRLLSGDGEALYVIGVSDEGEIKGISEQSFSETVEVIEELSISAGAQVKDVETWDVENMVVGLVTVRSNSEQNENNLVIGTAGHVDHGKSTLVGSLVTGDRDNGSGELRSYLDVKPHEIKRGLSADLSYAVYGFNGDGEPIRLNNPARNHERSEIVKKSSHLVSFVDTVGHDPWLRTTIRGIVGQQLDYGLLVVAADDGPTKTTKEHLGILLATELPTIVAITKSDKVNQKQIKKVKSQIDELLRDSGRKPIDMDTTGVQDAVKDISSQITPVITTSAVEGKGLDKLDEMFYFLDKRSLQYNNKFKMYIDRTYTVDGVGTVASGTIKSGTISNNDTVLIGPYADGTYNETKVRSMEIHYHRVNSATAGQIVSISLQNIPEDEIRRGMILTTEKSPKSVKRFKANVMVLNHPTRISDGYEPVVHIETASEAAAIYPQSDNLLPGERGKAELEFKYNSYNVSAGQRFVFREGDSKGIGTVTEVYE
jgi:elongation factor 1-alpha